MPEIGKTGVERPLFFTFLDGFMSKIDNKKSENHCFQTNCGGAYRIRTGDLYNANVARYQGIRTLSQIYAPVLQTSQSRTAYQRLYHLEGNSYSTLL